MSARAMVSGMSTGPQRASQRTRPFLVGTNLKMNQTPAESASFAADLARAVGPRLAERRDLRVYVCPPFTSLAAAGEALLDTPIWLGAQNLHWAPEGAYTGEVSAPMLRALGVELVLVGHAERRRLFRETDAELNKKVCAALGAGLRVLLCVGETADEKSVGVGRETVARQLKIDLFDVNPTALPRLQVAYEPVWSIGAGGTPARPEDVAEIAGPLRATLRELFGDAGDTVPILYGGSVDAANAGTFTALPEIDGLLLGRSGWTVESFAGVLAAALRGRDAGVGA